MAVKQCWRVARTLSEEKHFLYKCEDPSLNPQNAYNTEYRSNCDTSTVWWETRVSEGSRAASVVYDVSSENRRPCLQVEDSDDWDDPLTSANVHILRKQKKRTPAFLGLSFKSVFLSGFLRLDYYVTQAGFLWTHFVVEAGLELSPPISAFLSVCWGDSYELTWLVLNFSIPCD